MKSGLLLALFLLVAVACTTVVPEAVTNDQPSWDGNQQNSGVVATNGAGGLIVSEHWRFRYNQMQGQYADPSWGIRPDAGVTPWTNGTWQVDAQHAAYFSAMNQRRKSGK